MSKNSILTIQLCYVKLKSLESDVSKWDIESLRNADKAEVYALLDRIRSVKGELDGISTIQLARLTKKEVKGYEKKCQELLGQWKEFRSVYGSISDNMYMKYFKILGIKPTVDFEAIKKAYKKRAQETHPDHNNGKDGEFLKVKEAYDKLKAVYDK